MHTSRSSWEAFQGSIVVVLVVISGCVFCGLSEGKRKMLVKMLRRTHISEEFWPRGKLKDIRGDPVIRRPSSYVKDLYIGDRNNPCKRKNVGKNRETDSRFQYGNFGQQSKTTLRNQMMDYSKSRDLQLWTFAWAAKIRDESRKDGIGLWFICWGLRIHDVLM